MSGIKFFTIFTFRPDSSAIFLSTLLLLIIYKCPERFLLSAFLTNVLLHTKQIMVVMFFPILIYYLVMDRRLALKYFIACAIIGLVSAIAIRFIFPLYWGACIYSLSDTMPIFKLITAYWNITKCLFKYLAFILLGFAGLSVIFIHSKGNFFSRVKKIFSLFRNDYITFLIINLISSLLFLSYFARTGGDGLKYCLDMLAPSILIISIYVWKFLRPISKEKILIFFIAVSGLSVSLCSFNEITFEVKDIQQYMQTWETIKQYDKDEPIFLEMLASNYLVSDNNKNFEKRNIWFDDGHIEIQNRSIQYNGSRIKKLLTHIMLVDEIYKAGREYAAMINQMAKDKKFSLIVRCSDWPFIQKEILDENYEEFLTTKCKTMVDDPQSYWTLTFYRPK